MKARVAFLPLLLFCGAALFGQDTLLAPKPAEPARMKGVWVAAISGNYPRQKTADSASLKAGVDFVVDECARLGFNAIFFQVRPSCDALYKSKIFPWSEWLTGTVGAGPQDGFDPLKYFCEAAHKKNIALHAWINPYRIKAKKGQSLEALLSARPRLKQLRKYIIPSADGNYWLDPGQPRVRRLIINGAKEILKNYDVDGLHLDDYFYPQTGIDDAASFKKYGDGDELADYRRRSVNILVRDLHSLVKKTRPDADFGISPFGIWANKSAANPYGSDTRGTESYSAHFADSIEWIKSGWLDYIVPQIYWERGHKAADYTALAEWWNGAVEASGIRLYIGLGDYKAAAALGDPKSPWRDGQEIREQIEFNKSLKNVAGEIHFNFDSALQVEKFQKP